MCLAAGQGGTGRGREENRNQDKQNSNQDTLLTLGCLASSLAACLSVSRASLPPYVCFLPPTSQTPHRCGRSERFYVKDSIQTLKMRRQPSTVGVRNRQRRTSQQALIHSDLTLTLLALVQTTAAASRQTEPSLLSPGSNRGFKQPTLVPTNQ